MHSSTRIGTSLSIQIHFRNSLHLTCRIIRARRSELLSPFFHELSTIWWSYHLWIATFELLLNHVRGFKRGRTSRTDLKVAPTIDRLAPSNFVDLFFNFQTLQVIKFSFVALKFGIKLHAKSRSKIKRVNSSEIIKHTKSNALYLVFASTTAASPFSLE